jgi:PEP-CTERM putative exosortase interaction domain
VAALRAQPTIISIVAVRPSLSSSFTTWRSNVIAALKQGYETPTFGTPGTPSYFTTVSGTLPVAASFHTPDFVSWMGSADPASVYGAAYANELGSSIAFAGVVLGNGTQVSLSQLSQQFTLGHVTSPTLTTGNYGSSFVGVNYGLNGAFGGGDDTYVTSGSAAQLVDALIFTGNSSGNLITGASSGSTNQEKLDIKVAALGTTSDISALYSMTGPYGTVSSTYVQHFASAIPEPSAYAGIGGAFVLALALIVRRKKPSS